MDWITFITTAAAPEEAAMSTTGPIIWLIVSTNSLGMSCEQQRIAQICKINPARSGKKSDRKLQKSVENPKSVEPA